MVIAKPIKYVIDCGRCESMLLFSKSEITRDHKTLPGHEGRITCPECGRQVLIYKLKRY